MRKIIIFLILLLSFEGQVSSREKSKIEEYFYDVSDKLCKKTTFRLSMTNDNQKNTFMMNINYLELYKTNNKVQMVNLKSIEEEINKFTHDGKLNLPSPPTELIDNIIRIKATVSKECKVNN